MSTLTSDGGSSMAGCRKRTAPSGRRRYRRIYRLNITDAIHVATGARAYLYVTGRQPPPPPRRSVDNFVGTVRGGEIGSLAACVSRADHPVSAKLGRDGNHIATSGLARTGAAADCRRSLPSAGLLPPCRARNCLLYNYTTLTFAATAATDAADDDAAAAADAVSRTRRRTLSASSVKPVCWLDCPLHVASVGHSASIGTSCRRRLTKRDKTLRFADDSDFIQKVVRI